MTRPFKDDKEYLLRAVYPMDEYPELWEQNGRKVKSSAFEDTHGKGCSVVRSLDRTLNETLESMKGRFEGYAAVVNVKECKEQDVVLQASKDSDHAELHGSKQSKLLTRRQRVHLARAANKRKPRKIPL